MKQEFFDAGMFVGGRNGTETVIWRDYSFGNGDEEWAFSYSTCGELKGDVPPQYKKQVEDILSEYKKYVPFKYISNVESAS